MEIKLVKLGLRFYTTMSLRRIREVTGVNSQYQPGHHFIMWDFDDTPLSVVKESLEFVQNTFKLPSITIIQTKAIGYHAYCFRDCTWLEARGILAFTPNIDNHYLAIGIGRGYFTLRITDMPGRQFKHIETLHSDVPSDISYKEVNSFVKYTKAES